MALSAHADSSVPPPPANPWRARAAHKRHIQPTARYLLLLVALIVIAVLAQFAVHAVRAEPRDTLRIAQRELQLNTLAPGEQVIRSIPVFRRPAVDYFRATRGLLVLTNKRLLYLGLEPRDLLAAPDLPPTFEERDFPLDTMVRVSSGRTFFGLAKAVVIATPASKLRLGVSSSSWPKADVMIVSMDARRSKALAASVAQRKFLAKTEAERQAAEAARRKPRYYTVQRGDALGSVATMWNITPDMLRGWNHLANNTIRVGQVLMVKPAT